MAISQFATITDAVLTILRADTNLSAVTISDGLPITEDRLVDLVIIGNSGNPEDSRSGTIRQEWHDLAGINSTRDETVEIFCAILSQTGDVDVSTTRTRAFQILGWVSDAIRANYSGGLTNVIRIELTDVEVNVDQFADGTAVRLPFTITAESLI